MVKACKKGSTLIPKWKKCYDLNFKIKDPSATRDKHHAKIKKLKQSDVKYSDILDPRVEDSILSSIVGTTQFHYRAKQLEEKKQPSVYDVNQIKQMVNWKTREQIVRSLEYEDLSKSWDTAFYIANYNKINNLMKKMTKEIIKDYL